MIKVGLMGFGTVGMGVYKVVNSKRKEWINTLGEDIEVKRILVKDLEKKRKLNINKNLLTDNAKEILDDKEIDIIIEVMGGMIPAYEYICYALKHNKHVITANKEVVSKYLEEFLELAEKNNKSFLFEASVGGGIPIIKPLNQISLINDITEIKGILNGTSNFILTKMMDNCASFSESLLLAQELGYAEANPKADIEGDDAARKLSILTSLAFKTKISTDSMLYRGISSIDKIDVLNFKSMNKSVKLIATAIKEDKRISAAIEPVLVDESSQFANVKDNFNMVSIIGNTVQELQFYGRGAGEEPTANAVVCDMIDIVGYTYFIPKLRESKEKYIIDMKVFKGDYYFRISTSKQKEIENVISLLDKSNIKYEVLEKTHDFVLKIKSICTDDMEMFISKIKKSYDNFCYVRIDK